MDGLKAKLKRWNSKHGFKRDGSTSSRTSTVRSAATSTRGSTDVRPGDGGLRKSRSGKEDGDGEKNGPVVDATSDENRRPKEVTTSTSNAPVPELVVSSPPPHSHFSTLEISTPEKPTPTTIQTIPYSTLAPTTEAGPSHAAITLVISPSTQPSIESSKLWETAYKQLRKDQHELVVNYEIILKHAAGIPQKADLREEVARVVGDQKEKMENGQWTFQWNDKPKKVKDVVYKILKITDKASCLIAMGMAYAPPYISLPWAAIGAILPFMMSGFAEEEEGISGLETIAKIISSYRIVEDAFLLNPQFAQTYTEAVLPLYVKILEYQAIAAQYFGKHMLTRFGAGMVKATTWSDSLAGIATLDNRCRGSVLHLGISAQQAGFRDLMKMFEKSDEMLKAYLKDFFGHRDEVEQLMSDLSTIPYKQDHRDVRKELGSAYYDCGQWFLKHDTITNWRDWKPSFNVVWLVGSVGTGKSSLTSMLLEDFATNPSGSLAFFYCSKKASKKDQQLTARDSVENVLRTLIMQLSMSSDGSSISDEIREYHTASKQGIRGGGMELEDCITLLEGIVSKENRPRITIVIDALDECLNFPELLKILQKVFGSTDTVRIFVSSRFEVDVQVYIPKAQKIVLEQQNGADILTYVDTEIAERRVGSGLTDEQAVELKSIVMRRHEGMFIWVVLVVDDVLDQNEEDRMQMEDDIQIRIDALKDSDETDIEKMLRTAYDGVYIKAIGKKRQPARRHIVDAALKWTLCSFRPLTLAELTYACSIQANGSFTKNIQSGMILDFCSNFLIEGSGGVVRFAHLSVKHYLEKKEPPDYSSLETHAQAATTCLFFKNSPHFDEITTSTLELSYRANSSLAKSFSSYVRTYWARHCREAKQSAEVIEEDPGSHDRKSSNGNVNLAGNRDSQEEFFDSTSQLKLSARNSDLIHQVQKLIDQFDPRSTAKHGHGQIPEPDLLRDAIRLGDEEAVERLIAADVDVNARNEFGNSILHDAVRWKQLRILERLIDVEADLNAKNFNGDTPLHFAAYWGFGEVLQALISMGADRSACNQRGETPLHIAVVQKHKELVRILLFAGVNENATDKLGNTPLVYAKRSKDTARDDTICNLLDPPAAKDPLSYTIPPVTFPGLCDYCDIVRWISKSPKTTFHKHWPSHEDLKASAKSGCSLCVLFLRGFEDQGCQAILEKGYPSDLSISLQLVSRQTFSDSDNDILRATMGGTLDLDFELCLDPGTDLGPLKNEISGRLIAQKPSDQSCFDLIKGWLKDCGENHSQCNMEPSTLPTRIIDVGPLDGSQEPFLYSSKPGEVGNYVYLSAKRGGASDDSYLVSSNLEAYLKAIPLLSLPKTFEDAILITRRLGIRYLWIDAYCILQDRGGWVAEAAKIGQYLRNSTFTLIAASATGANHGIYEEREFYKPLIQLPCHEISPQSTSTPPWTGTLCLRRPTRSALEAMSSSVLQRGWMVQELVLPERNVIFGNEQIYWNCQTLSRAEDTIHHQNPLLRLTGTANGTTPVAGEEYSREIMERWYHLAEIYSGTVHARPKDRLPGLSHMVKHMLAQINTPYFAGLWRSSFHRGLLWRTKTIVAAKRFEVYIAPSWSWASFNGPVSYTLGLTGASSEEAEILDVRVVIPPVNTTGVVESGFLRLRGWAKTVSKRGVLGGCSFYFDDDGWEGEWRGGGEFVCVWVVRGAGLVLNEEGVGEWRRVGLVVGEGQGQGWQMREFLIV